MPTSAVDFTTQKIYFDGLNEVEGLAIAKNALSISPDGRHIIATGGNFRFLSSPNRGALIVFSRDVVSGHLAHVQTLTHGENVSEMVTAVESVFSPDGQHVYVVAGKTSFFGGRYLAFSRDSISGELTEIASYDGGFINNSIAITPDGSSLYIGGGHGLIAVSRQLDGTLTPIADSEDSIYHVEDIAISSDGQNVYVAGDRCASSGTCFSVYGIEVFQRDPSTGRLTSIESIEIPSFSLTNRIAISPGGGTVFVGGSGVTTFTRDPSDGSLTFLAHRSNSGGGNGQNIYIKKDGSELFTNGVLYDITNPVVVNAIEDTLDIFPGNEFLADPAFNHFYVVGYNPELDRTELRLLYHGLSISPEPQKIPTLSEYQIGGLILFLSLVMISFRRGA